MLIIDRHRSASPTGIKLLIVLFVASVSLSTGHLSAQEYEQSPEATEAREKMHSIAWSEGPITGLLGTIAELRVPENCRFASSQGAKTFLELTHNIPSGNELGVLLCMDRQDDERQWFVIYTYDPSGYVKDDEKKKLDEKAILASLRRGTEEGNKERRARGWEEMRVEGWVRPPYYDERTNNLTWSFTGRSSDGDVAVNHSVRLLGRGGVLHADLVMDPSQISTVVPDFDSVVESTSFTSGNRYAEWREGDKVAAYGLTALIAGGAGAAAMKTGLLGKLAKVLIAMFAALWKMVAVAVVGILGMLKSIFTRKPKPPAGGASRMGDGG